MTATSPAAEPCPQALVIHSYALLGEGLADLLRERGVRVTLAAASDPDAVAAGLALRPCLVVVDRTSPEVRAQVAASCPDARVVDVTGVVGRGRPAASDLVRFEAILDALAAAQL